MPDFPSARLVVPFVIPLLLASRATSAQSPWRLSDPVVELGGGESAGFGSVTGAFRRTDGGIIAADGQALELRYFDARGRFVARAGRKGDGPGELRSIRALLRCGGDSAFVYDPVLLRVSVFAPSGRYVRAIDLRAAGIAIPPYDAYCNGRGMLVFVNRSPSPPAAIGPRRPMVELTALPTSGSGLKSLGSYPASERYFTGREDMPRPLGALTLVAVGPSAIHVSTGRDDAGERRVEIRRMRADGTPLPSAIVDVPRAKVTSRLRQAFIDAQVDAQRSRSDGARVRSLLEALKYPDELPPLARLLVGAGGDVWASEYPNPTAKSVRWHVIAPDGAMRATLMAPSALDILDLGDGALLGVWRDDMGVSTLRVYRFGARDGVPDTRP